MRMLSMRISALRVGSACTSVPYTHAQHGLKGPFQFCNFYAYAQHTRKKLIRMLRVLISSWLVCSANASVPDPLPGDNRTPGGWRVLAQGSGCASVPDVYAQHFFKGMRSVHALVPDVYAQRTHQFLTRMLSLRISSWRACSVHASVPDGHAQCTHQCLTRMLRVYKMNIWKIGKLMRMLSMRVKN
jgi:hypothetical protein